MTGLEPHPVFTLPTRGQIEALERAHGREVAAGKLQALAAERARLIRLEQEDPFTNGYRPPIWYVADELLEDGKEVVLADPDWDLDDPALKKIRPPDFLAEALRRRQLKLGRLTITGKRELWIAGSNRSSKTEYAAYKIVTIGANTPDARTWSWSDSEEKSQAKQQPVIYKYLPIEWKKLLNAKGKARDATMKMGYGPDGFTGNKFAAVNGWRHWCNNYKQDLRDVEGDQLDGSWHDEERDPERIKTIRVRLGDRRGIMLVTFTSIDDSFVAVVSEYETGMIVVLEVEAEWLPKIKTTAGIPYEKEPGMIYEKVRRVAVAGPGSDGDQKANILHFHISDNPYYGYKPGMVQKPGEPPPVFGKKHFYVSQNIASATRKKVLSRAYGILTRGAMQQFRFNGAVHVVDPGRIPKVGTRYLVLDPCPGRNWFMIWILIDAMRRWFIYREWPSYGGLWKSAYIPGIGDPEPWALPGTTTRGNSRKVVFDGLRGPAQNPFQFGLSRYKEEIERMETEKGQREEIFERWMDARYASSPTIAREAPTTQIAEMLKAGLDFKASPSEQNILTRDDGSIAMINEGLDYDEEVDLGQYSPRLSRLNEPRLFVSSECPNVAFSLKEWTGKDGQHGACKDPADCIRYAALCGLDYIGANAFQWSGGGAY